MEVYRQKSSADRLAEIATVLGRYGFSHIYRTKIRSHKTEQDAVRLRQVFEELGPTFIKFGQILSTRRDLLPQNYIDELSKLRDSAPPFSFSDVQTIIERELNQPISTIFSWLDEIPLASASVAQVHRGILRSGEEVIVKVQRPNMEEEMLRDIDLFSRVIQKTPGVMTNMFIDANAAIEEIKLSTQLELDFRNEARAISEFKRLNRHREVVGAPIVYPQYLSKRVLVEEYVDGIQNMDKHAIIQADYQPRDVAQKLIYAMLLHIFKDGFFHADPHQGNLIIRDGQIVFIDFGIHGHLSANNRDQLLRAIQAVVFEDVDQLLNVILQMAIIKKKVNRFELYDDISNFFYMYATRDLKNLHMRDFFGDVLSIAHKHHLIMPNDFIVLARAITILEGVVTELDGSISIMEIAKTFLKGNEEIDFSRSWDLSRLSLGAMKSAEDLLTMPTDLRKVLRTLSEGRTKIYIDFAHIDEKATSLNRMINRIVFAVIIAALILASALIAVSAEGTGLSIFSIIIFLGAGLMGLWLLYSIIRSGML